MNWETVELLGYAYFSELGYRILVPAVRNDGYDFVAERDGEFVRVNVKLAGLKDSRDPHSWSISQASASSATHRSSPPKCDVLLAYLPDQRRFVELPGDFLNCGNSKSRRIPINLYAN